MNIPLNKKFIVSSISFGADSLENRLPILIDVYIYKLNDYTPPTTVT